MLHFPDVETEDKTIMLENKYTSSSRRYLEKRLHDICKYKKSNLNFTDFEPYINDAINREKLFEEDLIKLKDNLGSNVGILINEMINSK
jgi:hypothetical protein